MVSEKKSALAVFNGIVFNASVKQIEFKSPNTKLPIKIEFFLIGFPVTNEAYLNPIFVRMLKNIANQSIKLLRAMF